jgi:hypothetical protein
MRVRLADLFVFVAASTAAILAVMVLEALSNISPLLGH